jgi:hypothetical protein
VDSRGCLTVFIVVAMLIFWSVCRNARSAQQRPQAHDADVQTTLLFTILSIVFRSAGELVSCLDGHKY